MLRALILFWAIVVAAGLTLLWNYEWRSGASLPGQEHWPAQAAIQPDANCYNLVISLHPHCPCSEATVEELNKILARTRAPLHVHAIVFEPDHADPLWSRSAITDLLHKLPDTTVMLDKSGEQALLFGAQTSGDTQLFAPNGERLFHGGITASRGHAGDNDGADAILSYLSGARGGIRKTPVFGCAIQTPRGKESR